MVEFFIKTSYWKTGYVIPYTDADRKDEEFYELLQTEYEKVGLPNSEFSAQIFGNKKKNYKMFSIKFSDVKQFRIWYRASIVGNLLVLSVYEVGDFPNFLGADLKVAAEWVGRYLFY